MNITERPLEALIQLQRVFLISSLHEHAVVSVQRGLKTVRKYAHLTRIEGTIRWTPAVEFPPHV
jgi:hypothetical protein